MGLVRANRSVAVLIVGIAAMSVLPIVKAGDLGNDSGNGWSADLITSVPRTMSYQGILKDSGGNSVTDSVYNVTFRIFNLESGGSSLWDQTSPCTTSAGYFNAVFDNVNLPFDESYWLELEIDSEILDPRQKMNMVGYAAVADTADYAFNAPAGGGTGWVDDGAVVRLETSADRVGIGTSSPLTKLHVVADSNYALAGSVAPTGSDEYIGTIGIVEGGSGTNTGVLGSASDGGVNRGVRGEADGPGNENIGVFGTATDGTFNRGLIGEAHGQGDENIGVYGYAEGGDDNWAGYFNGDVGVAQNTEIQGKATIGPGNTNTGTNAFVAGESNTAIGDYAAVSGGFNNIASIEFTALGGGVNNTASGPSAALGGGVGNTASGTAATVSGGGYNTASGNFSAIPGGGFNEAVGEYSYAAGRRAKANHSGTFVWADSTDADFTSTGDDQFLIRASGGVGIGWHGPEAALHIQPTSLPLSSTGPTGLLISTPATLEDSYGIQVSCFAANATGARIVGGFHGVDAVSANGEAIRAEGFVGIHAMSTGDTAGFFEGNIIASGDLEIQGKAAIGPGSASDGDNSFAAGTRAKADHNGTFVWGDSTDADFTSTGDDQFLIRASGGVGIGTDSPQGALDVSSTTGAFIVPRMTTLERNALIPVNGMIIYNIGNNQFNFYENGAWVTK